MAHKDKFISGMGNLKSTVDTRGTITRNPRNIGGNGNNLYFEPYCLPSSTNPGYFYPIGDDEGTLNCNPNAPKPYNPTNYGGGPTLGGGNNNSIIQTNLMALRNDFVYKSSGQPYEGPFHVHANGTLMIGASQKGINHIIKPNEVIVPNQNQTMGYEPYQTRGMGNYGGGNYLDEKWCEPWPKCSYDESNDNQLMGGEYPFEGRRCQSAMDCPGKGRCKKDHWGDSFGRCSAVGESIQ